MIVIYTINNIIYVFIFEHIPCIRNFCHFIIFQAVTCFVILAYIHNAFSRTPIDCLDNVKDKWPRDGVLRVVISRSSAVSRLSENNPARTNISNSNISEPLNVNISNLGVDVMTDHENSSSVGDLYGYSSDSKPQKNHLPVRDTVVPSAFELLAPIKVEGRLIKQLFLFIDLLLTVFEVRTVSYGLSFFPLIFACGP